MMWEKPPLDRGRAREIAACTGLEGSAALLAAAVLARRGLDDPEAIRFFAEEDPRFLHNPFLFQDMEDAVERIQQARAEGERVLVFGDRDVDGITATALVVEALSGMGMDVRWRLPQGDEPYGLTTAVVEMFAAENGSLIVTVDCGISCLAEVERANELGVDTIIIDHHLPQTDLPAACAIVNPKLEEDSYPFRDLAACAVAAKLAWALAFSETPFYNQSITLLNIRPANGTYVLEAIRLKNLVEYDRVRENLVPGLVAVEQTRLLTFFSGPLYVYDAPPQVAMLKKLFGSDAEINLTDTAPEIWKIFPQLKDKSLLAVRELSRLSRCRAEGGEIDALRNLFVSWALSRERRVLERFESTLDLVAVGTVADIMPLLDENHIMVRRGLRRINSLERPALRELLRAANLAGRDLSGRDLAWQVCPLLNAAGRMGRPEVAAELLLSDQPARHIGLAGEIVRMNQERKRLGEESWQHLLPLARASLERHDGKLIFLCSDRVQRGLTGILASRMVTMFNVPAVVCAGLEDKIVGSLRSARGYVAAHFLQRCADLFQDYGGHDFAAGFNLRRETLGLFEERILSVVPDIALADSERRTPVVDAEIPPALLTPELEAVIDFFAPYGEGNPPLLFGTPGVQVVGIDLLGKREQVHAKLSINAGAHIWPGLFWNSAERIDRDFSKGERVDILYHIEKNFFQNRKSLQLNIVDIRRQEPA